jgi:UDP-GlcNAc3NAcA epimerase
VRVISIVGARPQFVKAAVICWAADRAGETIDHRLIHTGQHYDAEMSDIFFEEMGIPAPAHNLEVGSGGHGVQTGEMMKRLEPVLVAEKPDWVLLYGDTNSTLAGAAVAAKLHLRVAHIEAGLRSFNRRMPEELNRIVADHLSDLLLCPTATAMQNLEREGLGSRAILTGDVMYDAALKLRASAERRGGALGKRWRKNEFALATIHRAENTDDPQRLRGILNGLERIAEGICPVVLPLHPRTSKTLAEMGCTLRFVEAIRPVSYLDMLLLEGRARFILTDSGGVQKEAYFAKAPCITLRDETEWIETLENRCNTLAGANEEKILAAAEGAAGAGPWTNAYGEGHAGAAILNAVHNFRAS